MTFELIHWRLFTAKKLILKKKNTLIYGLNGSGKTTVLSALYGLYTGEAWPGTVWRQQIKTNEDYFGIKVEESPDWYLSGVINSHGRIVTKYMSEIPEEWKYTVLSYLPDENRWLTLSRSARLALFDRSLASIYGKPYSDSLKKLEKAVLNKSRVIKRWFEDGVEDLVLVAQLDTMVRETSQVLWQYRKDFFLKFASHLVKFRDWIESDISSEKLRWTQSLGRLVVDGFTSEVMPVWQEVWRVEKQVGRVFYGAQRDDVQFQFNGQAAENFLSRGENRAFLIFFKQFVRSNIQGRALWLLDDFFNEFDERRERLVLEQLVQQDDWIIATATRKIDGFSEYIAL